MDHGNKLWKRKDKKSIRPVGWPMVGLMCYGWPQKRGRAHAARNYVHESVEIYYINYGEINKSGYNQGKYDKLSWELMSICFMEH